MAQSYKVFFKDRVIFLTSQIDDILGGEFNAILKYSNQNELRQFIENFARRQHLKVGYIYFHDIDKLLELFSRIFQCIDAAGGLVTNNHHQFLAMKRLGIYDLPKGKAEPGETPIKTALREIEEECGITSHDVVRQLATTYHTYRIEGQLVLKKTYWFHFHANITQPPVAQQSENITDVNWMDLEQLDEFMNDTYESIKEVIYEYRA